VHLFRQEVADQASGRLYGEIALGTPIPWTVTIYLLIATALFIAAGLYFISYDRTEAVSGHLVTQEPSLKVFARGVGSVAKLNVRDGQLVQRGELLATVDRSRLTDLGKIAEREILDSLSNRINLARNKIELADSEAVEQRSAALAALRSAEANLVIIQHQRALQQDVVESNERIFQNIEPVMKRGFLSRLEYEQRLQTLLSSKSALEGLRIQESSITAAIADATARLNRINIQRDSSRNDAGSSVQALEADRANERAEQRYSLFSPISGRVSALHAAVGKEVKSDVPLMTIVPADTGLEAVLYAPSRAAGFLAVGQKVRLLYDAFPYEHFGTFPGTITSVSATTTSPAEIDTPLPTQEPVYEIRVHIDRNTGQFRNISKLLQPGMTLSANVILEKRTFLEWLLLPTRKSPRRN
jgi:membrane fusion protein